MRTLLAKFQPSEWAARVGGVIKKGVVTEDDIIEAANSNRAIERRTIENLICAYGGRNYFRFSPPHNKSIIP